MIFNPGPGAGPYLLALCLLIPTGNAAAASEAPVGGGPAYGGSLFRLGWGDAGWAASALGLQGWAQVRYFDMEPARPSELDPADLLPLDRWAAGNYSAGAALASDLLLFPLVASPMALLAWDARGGGRYGEVLTEAVIYSEALALSSALNLLVRSTRVHPRPLVYGSDAPAEEKRKGEASGSFYSGHANASFLAATYLAYTYPLRHPEFEAVGWLRAGAYGYAAVVAGLRVAAGKHFPSDILVGAAAGTCFGWLLPRLHLRPGVAGAGDRRLGMRILPLEGGAHALLTYRL